MPRYKLRTLLILLAVLPPVLAVGWWNYSAWRAEQQRQRLLREKAVSGQPYTFVIISGGIISGATVEFPPAPPPVVVPEGMLEQLSRDIDELESGRLNIPLQSLEQPRELRRPPPVTVPEEPRE